VDFIKKRRRENAQVLLNEFADMAMFPKLGDEDCPTCVPIVVPNGKRDALRQFLIQKEIYCPVHWTLTEMHQVDEKMRFVYDKELSLVCDQRYTQRDMNRMIQTIKDFFAEENKNVGSFHD
jgi:dTDP-4-amino-4,6-dideoxygalactose transaminase